MKLGCIEVLYFKGVMSGVWLGGLWWLYCYFDGLVFKGV